VRLGGFTPYTSKPEHPQIPFVFDLTDWDEYFFKPRLLFLKICPKQTNKRTEQTKKHKQNQLDATSRVNEQQREKTKPKWVASGGIKRSIWIGTNRKNQVEGRRRRE
jgi:hypothetical protein